MNKNRVLIYGLDELITLINALPSLYMIKKMNFEDELVVLMKEKYYDIVQNLGFIDRIIKTDIYTKNDLIEKIQYFNAATFISFVDNETVKKMAKSSGAKKRIGIREKFSDIFTYNKGVFQNRDSANKQEMEYNLDLTKRINSNKFRVSYEFKNTINFNEQNINVAQMFLDENNLNELEIVTFAPFIEEEKRNLNIDSYALMLENFMRKYNSIKVIFCCYIEEENKAIDFIEKIPEDLRKRIYLFANGGSILNLAAIISKSPLFIGGCSGITALANVVCKNIVAIYDIYNVKRYGLIGTSNVSYIEINDKNRNDDISEDLIEVLEKIL